MLTNATGDGGHGGMLSLIMAWNKTSLPRKKDLRNQPWIQLLAGCLEQIQTYSPNGGENMVIYHGIIRTKKTHLKQTKENPTETPCFFAPQQTTLDFYRRIIIGQGSDLRYVKSWP